MSELLIKPYEISVWEEKLAQNGSGLIETKLAVIGSNTMTGLNKIYEPIFTKKANGEKTLTFSLKYKYFDPFIGADDIVNPFAALLVNERKIKLKYDDQWYEFIIKDHTESSDGLVWTYSCSDAFVLELSKIGYNITFDAELNNNQGTAQDLAEKTLENTDWRVRSSNIGKQMIEEPVYKGTLESKTGITIINATGDGTAIPDAGAQIYVFYNYVKNESGDFVQFIIRDENKEYTIDNKNVITDTNFRITTPLTYKNNGFYLNNLRIISLGEIETKYHVNRLAYSQLTTYDPVMERVVDQYRSGTQEIYKYSDYSYSTSNIVTNLITNGENFNILDDGTLQGWNPYVESTATVQALNLVTKPELGTGKSLVDLSKISQIEGFLKVHFNGALTNSYQNAIFNSGIENHASLIKSISKGQKFIFRWRAGVGSIDNLNAANNLGLIVAKYTQNLSASGYYYKHIDSNNIILKIQGTPQILNNKISGGSINTINQTYIIDGVPQTPSTRYIYINSNDNELYRWDSSTETFIQTTESSGLPYYYLVGQASTSISEDILTDPSENIGIFIYTTGAAGDYFIQDIQFTEYILDKNNNPVLIGNVPEAASNTIDYYYLKPYKGAKPENIQTYASAAELREAFDFSSDIVPLYNENSVKYLTISESHSNCFNILQSIAETFECWVDLVVEHTSNGAIAYDSNGKPQKYVYLKEYIGKDNWAGFKYGINLQSIERTINSDEIVTKLIVDQSQSDYVEEGYVSIANAASNPSEEAYILNFNYYYSQGLLNRDIVEADKNTFINNVQKKNLEIKKKQKRYNELEMSRVGLESKHNIYSELIKTAINEKNEAIEEFEQLTNESYEDYRQKHSTLPSSEQLTEEETLLDVLGRLYNNSSIINNYAGLETNAKNELDQVIREIPIIENEIETLINEKNQLVNNFHNKYSHFIQEGTWSSTDYIDSERYYLDALQVSNTSAQPTVSYTINVVEVSQLEGLELYLFDAGDKSYIEDTEFFGWSNVNGNLTPAREEVIVSEVEWHLDRPEENIITVQNYKTRFEDLFQRISATVQTVQYNEATYAKISSLMDANGTINQNVLLTAMNNIAGERYNLTSDGSIIINGDEILIQNLTNRTNRVILNSEGIRISSDGGQTWSTAISGRGIDAGTIFTGSLNTDNIIIGNNKNPSFRWDKSGISAYGSMITSTSTGEVVETYDLQTYVRYDQYGLYGIKEGGSFKARNLSDVLNKAHFAVTWDGFFIKNTYPQGGKVEITSENDFRVLNTIQGNLNEKIKIGALEWEDEQGNIYTDPSLVPTTVKQQGPSLYGIRIKNDAGAEVMKTDDEGNIHIEGDITAVSGHIGGMVVDNDKLSMDTIVLEPGVGIYSTVTTNGNRMFSISDVDGGAVFRYIEALGGKLGNLNVINTLTVGDGAYSGLIKSDNYISDFSGWMINSAGYAEFSNAKVRGHIEAETGDFTGWVAVGDRTQNPLTNPYIIISGGVTDAAEQAYGSKAIIKTSNYQDGVGYGWMINSDGDAYFNNITARGAIKTAVFEYAEIQAVGGIFIFRPSSTIRKARIDNNDLILKVEKPLIFCKISYTLSEDVVIDNTKIYYRRTAYGYEKIADPYGNPHEQNFYESTTQYQSWCKISNYTTDGSEPNVQNTLLTNGLTHVYKVSDVNLETAEVTLVNGKTFINAVKQNDQTINDVLVGLEGGALIDMGRENGSSNYGIGINSSDNTVNLPRRAISLFETIINEQADPKVSYNYRGILGTLPELSPAQARSSIYGTYMSGTQGIYTDNMYIGDNSQYLAFYEDNQGNKHLKISARDIVFEYDPETGTETSWEEHIDEQLPMQITVHSTMGTQIKNGQGFGALFVKVRQEDNEIDEIPLTVEAVTSLEDVDENATYCILCVKPSSTISTADTESSRGSATLYKKTGGSWGPVTNYTCTYTWTYHDKSGEALGSDSRKPALSGKCVYIDASLINSKITADVTVTKN